MKRQTKRPTRRKPDRPYKQYEYSTVGRYESPWWVTLYALGIVALVVGLPAFLSWMHLNGWY